MPTRMRAKFQVSLITKNDDHTSETLKLTAVGSDTYGPNGETEDADFARYTPSGEMTIVINNPNLFDIFEVGDKYYLDFSKAD